MKRRMITRWLAPALLGAGLTTMALAGNGTGRGCGYGGPPLSDAERAARQAACLAKNGGVCPHNGPQAECPRQAAGKGDGPGVCDGTGPKGPHGNRPGPRAGKPKN